MSRNTRSNLVRWMCLLVGLSGCGEGGDGGPDALPAISLLGPRTARPAPFSPAFDEYLRRLSPADPSSPDRPARSGRTLGLVPPPVSIHRAAGLPAGVALRAMPRPALPTSYDLRTTGKLSAVRDQGQCGACWTFAAMASLESGLLPAESKDFSENHLKNTSGFDGGACAGGNFLMTTAYLTRGGGPVLEADDPYAAGSAYSPSGLTVQKRVLDVIMLGWRQTTADNNEIKQLLLDRGAVEIYMHWEESGYQQDNRAYYFPTVGSENHAVSIVGWDDAFPRASFPTQPMGNGAFLVRNSWGTGWGESGYFYISYYDPTLGKSGSAVYVRPPNPVANITRYQYDPFGWTQSLGIRSGVEKGWMANVFTATAEQRLAEVGLYGTGEGASYDIYLYNHVTGAPVTSTLLGHKSGTLTVGGYHTIDVRDLEAVVAAGDRFSVVVNMVTPGNEYPIAVESRIGGYSSFVSNNPGESLYSEDGESWTDLRAVNDYFPYANVCLQVFAEPPCLDHDPCTADSFDGSGCVFTPVPDGSVVCRPAASPCDAAETCLSGSCPADQAAADGVVCRAAAGPCDVAETCLSGSCPADQVAASGIACRAEAGVCDVAESCTGNSAQCPTDGFAPSSVICRPSAGICDAAERCTGNAASCPADQMQPISTICRPAQGPCDRADRCTGLSASCPADLMEPTSTVCRPASGACDQAESCDGLAAQCPADSFKAAAVECRASQGSCDVAESCTGQSALCPDDRLIAAGTLCRVALGPCDAAEGCTGTSVLCPTDQTKPAGTICRPATGACDVEEVCNGVTVTCRVDALRPSGQVCRPAAGVCDLEEKCSGTSGDCPPDAFQPAGGLCRDLSGACDVPEQCTGESAACPGDQKKEEGTPCQAGKGACVQGACQLDPQEKGSGQNPEGSGAGAGCATAAGHRDHGMAALLLAAAWLRMARRRAGR